MKITKLFIIIAVASLTVLYITKLTRWSIPLTVQMITYLADHERENPNVDKSTNVALIAFDFRIPISCLLEIGNCLNLPPSSWYAERRLVNQVGSMDNPNSGTL